MSSSMEEELRRNEEAARAAPQSPHEAIQPERVPVPKKRRRETHPLLAAVNGLLSLAVFAIIAGGIALYIGKQRFDAPGPLVDDTSVIINRGDGVREIAELLQREGVISEQIVFVAGIFLHNARNDLKAGEYLFPAHVSMSEALDLIREGRVVLHRVTIPEGLTSQQIVQRLTEEEHLTGEITDIPREGSLLPETYSFTRGAKRQDILLQMRRAQERILAEVWENRDPDLPLETPEELVILASIVEKETGQPEERSHVASVFVNRLHQGMRLQSDPTIIYGIVGGQGSLGRPIRRSDIDETTPYNTYRIDGLPPTPIANPGTASLRAVGQPMETNDLFFVADGTGGHAFAETLEEHNENVARWRAIERERREAQEAEEAAEGSGNENQSQ
ncbi:MAG: endolytic transglycosylase MltG [Hyphomicrobiales bacterium]|nr:endolytic transglycosylase MltG [Hyphomicrobiales bacterium]